MLRKVFQKGEGAILQHANHVRNVESNNISDCIKFVFLRG